VSLDGEMNSGFSLPAAPAIWVSHYRDRLNSEYERISAGRPGVLPRQVMIDAACSVFEELLGTIDRALETRDSVFRQELALLPGAKRAVSHQVRAAQDAHRIAGRSPKSAGLVRFSRKALATLLAGIAIEVSGGLAVEMLSTGSRPESISIQSVAAACVALDEAVCIVENEIGVESSDAGSSRASESAEDSVEGDFDWDFDDDPWAALQDNDGNYRAPWSDDEHVGTIWRDNGFSPDESEEWDTGGFEPGNASAWRSAGLSVEEASDWAAADFDAFDAAAWRDALGDDARSSQAWAELGFEPDEAWDWSNEFEPAVAAEWMSEGFTPDDAAAWAEQGFSPPEAAAWYAANVDPERAAERRQSGFAADDARVQSDESPASDNS